MSDPEKIGAQPAMYRYRYSDAGNWMPAQSPPSPEEIEWFSLNHPQFVYEPLFTRASILSPLIEDIEGLIAVVDAHIAVVEARKNQPDPETWELSHNCALTRYDTLREVLALTKAQT